LCCFNLILRFEVLPIFQKLFTNVVISVAEYPTKPVTVLGKVQTSQKFGRITEKMGIPKIVRQISFFVFRANIPKKLHSRIAKLYGRVADFFH
jgi:hypothetical protein